MTIGVIIGAIDDHGTIRENLKVVKKGNIFIVVDTRRMAALCHDESCGLVTMNTPVIWEDSVAASEWVSSGSVKGLQRALGYPNVGFRMGQFLITPVAMPDISIKIPEPVEPEILCRLCHTNTPHECCEPPDEEDPPKKEFVVVEKLLDEHREVKNKIFIWLQEDKLPARLVQEF